MAIRTTAFGMELPLSSGTSRLLSPEALPIIVREMNMRLVNNFSRVDKFLIALKEFYGWPSLQIKGTVDQKYHRLERWGHVGAFIPSASTDKPSTLHVLGGFGVDERIDKSRKCQRKLPNVVLDTLLKSIHSDAVIRIDRVHAAGHYFRCGFTGSSNFILTGGRKSPQEAASPFIEEYIFHQDEFQLVESVVEQGDVPTPRWGHTLTEIGDTIFFLFGGRNDREIFGDGYILKKNKQTVWYWEKVFDL